MPKVPLADGTGGVAERLHAIGQRGLRERQSAWSHRIVLVAEARRIAAGHQPAREGEHSGAET